MLRVFPRWRFPTVRTTVLGLAVAAMLALAGASHAGGLPPCIPGEPGCWDDVVEDWLVDGSLEREHPRNCLRYALMTAPDDVRNLSSFRSAVRRAIRATQPDVSLGNVAARPLGQRLDPASPNVVTLRAAGVRFRATVREKRGRPRVRNLAVRATLVPAEGSGERIRRVRRVKSLGGGERATVTFWGLIPKEPEIGRVYVLTVAATRQAYERDLRDNRRSYKIVFALP